jgi:hypothetical protein
MRAQQMAQAWAQLQRERALESEQLELEQAPPQE